MGDVLRIILATALVNNLLLGQLLGVSSLFYSTDKQHQRLQQASELALATALVMLPASLVFLLIDRYLLQPPDVANARLVVLVAVSSIICLFLKRILSRYYPLSSARADLELCLVAGNSAVIGSSLLLVRENLSLLHSVAFSVGTALGFGILLMVFAALRDRLFLAPIPVPFKGTAIELIMAGIVAMSVLGFEGLV